MVLVREGRGLCPFYPPEYSKQSSPHFLPLNKRDGQGRRDRLRTFGIQFTLYPKLNFSQHNTLSSLLGIWPLPAKVKYSTRSDLPLFIWEVGVGVGVGPMIDQRDGEVYQYTEERGTRDEGRTDIINVVLYPASKYEYVSPPFLFEESTF